MQPASLGDSPDIAGGTVSSADPRLTLAETVDALNSAPTNDMVAVTFLPDGADGSSSASDVFTGTAHTNWVVSGRVTKSTSAMTLTASPAAVKRNERVSLRGTIQGASSTATVRIYRRYLGGGTDQLVATVTAFEGDDGAVFTWRSGRMPKAAIYTASWGGDDSVLGASASLLVPLQRG